MRDRWDLAPAAARARGDEGNRRLHQRWVRFIESVARRTPIANVAIARELAGWCWSLAVLEEGSRHDLLRRPRRLVAAGVERPRDDIYEQVLLPITPSGLGVVEGVLIPAVVSLGASASVALLGVLTWRLVQFWLPVPLALLTYISLRVGVLRNTRSQQERLSTEQDLLP